MLSVLANGVLINDPRERTAANGNKYATGALRVPVEEGEPMLVSFIAASLTLSCLTRRVVERPYYCRLGPLS
jgi:hypothetical protein